MTITDNDTRLLNAYIDGELDPAHALEFEQRLAADPALAAERRRIEALRRAIAERLPRATASPALRRRVAAMARPPVFAVKGLAGWAPVAASAAIAFAAGGIATLLSLGPGGREPLPERLQPCGFLGHAFARDLGGFAHAHDLVRGERTGAHAALVAAPVHLGFQAHTRLAPHVQRADTLGAVHLVA